MRSKNSMYNLIAATMLQVISLIIGIILPRVMLMSFGSEVNGLVSSIKQFISYLTLVEAGLAGACIYSLYKPLANKDYQEINSILSGARKFYNKSGIIFSTLAFALAIIFPYIVQSDAVGNLTVTVLVLILGINGALEFFSMGKYRALLTADQKSYVISMIKALAQVLNCIIIVIMALKGYSIVTVQFVATLSYVLRTVLFSVYVRKKYTFIDFHVPPSKKALHQRWDVLFHQVGAMVIFNSPIAFITFFCSLIEVSIYSVYNMVFAGIGGIVGIFNSGLVAGIGEIISKSEMKTLQRVYREYECGYYMIVTWIYTCTYILILPFIEVYTKGINDTNYIRKDIAIAFVIIGILNTLRMPQSTVIGAAGHFKETRYRALAEIIINIVASLILVNKFGMLGVLMGGICSYAYRTIDSIVYAPKYITHLTIRETVLRIIRMVIIGIIIVMPFNIWIHIQGNSFIEWIIWGCIVATWSGVLVFIGNYLCEKQTIHSLVKRVIRLVKH